MKQLINKARWYENAFSSSVMIVVRNMLVEICDIAALLAIGSINACLNLFGLMMEFYNLKTERTSWTALIFGAFPSLSPEFESQSTWRVLVGWTSP